MRKVILLISLLLSAFSYADFNDPFENSYYIIDQDQLSAHNTWFNHSYQEWDFTLVRNAKSPKEIEIGYYSSNGSTDKECIVHKHSYPIPNFIPWITCLEYSYDFKYKEKIIKIDFSQLADIGKKKEEIYTFKVIKNSYDSHDVSVEMISKPANLAVTIKDCSFSCAKKISFKQ